MEDMECELRNIEFFSSKKNLTRRISDIEHKLLQKDADELKDLFLNEGINDIPLVSALKIKEISGQIDVVIHALGILSSLSYILVPGEKIVSLSLGAGNTGKKFDLETNIRVAEFTFINWQGGSEVARQNKVFIDLFNLVEHDELNRKKYLYVIEKKYPEKFLSTSRRAIKSVLSKNNSIFQEFYKKYSTKYTLVSEYYNDKKNLIDIVDLKEKVPVFTKGRS